VKACAALTLARATFYRQPKNWRKADAEVIDGINDMLRKSPQLGFWKCYTRLRFKGFKWNHKRVYRVYCLMGLNLKRRVKRVLLMRVPKPLKVINKQWALDFMYDTLYCGKPFRTLNIIDEGTRECLGDRS